MSRFWGYSKRPKNWHKLLGKEITDEELDKAVIVAIYKESLSSPPDMPKITATIIKPVNSATPINLTLPGSASPDSVTPALAGLATPDSSTSY